ncbi:hypothetical protein HDC91_003488 [Mucilaginibacter sp. AK015]|nr:hypothetical protein [Mucilaginibacter sp. AK015]
MKPIIKYISLLLFSGLILPFYNSTRHQNAIAPGKTKAALNKHSSSQADSVTTQYFIYKDIAEMLFPNITN